MSVELGGRRGHTLGSNLPQPTRHLALFQKRVTRILVIAQRPQLLLELDGEGDDVGALPAVLLDPRNDLGQVLALLAHVVFHGQVDQVDDGFGGDELELEYFC